jgi:dihydroorotate dehydrogenase electron transfer subunit
MLKCKNEVMILKRPISLHYVDRENGILEFYFEVKGKGTKEFENLVIGDSLNLQGPLGTGFSTNLEGKEVMVVGGGMGNAPAKLLIEELKRNGKNVTFIAGGRDKEALNILENFNLENVKVYVATDDGSKGEKGTVVDVMRKLVEGKKYDAVFTCGPQKMMEAVVKITDKKDIFCEVSLEEKMACGVKACVGCSIKTLDGMKKVCHDGPVFNSKIIVCE